MHFYTNVAQRGNKMLYRGVSSGERGTQRVQKTPPFFPTLFSPSTNKDYGWSTIDGQPLQPHSFNSIVEAKDFIKTYSGVSGMPIFGQTNFVAQYIADEFPNEIKFDPNLIRTAYIDIEVQSEDGFPEPEDANHEVTAVCIHLSDNPDYVVFGLGGEYKGSGDFYYVQCDTEEQLLVAFTNYWESVMPDVVTGWNCKTFDIPYLIRRLEKIHPEGVRKMSPWGSVFERYEKSDFGEDLTYKIVGVEILDYLDLFKKFHYVVGVMESYTLNHVASVILGEEKLSYEEHGNLHTLYRDDYSKFLDYNKRDTELVRKLHDSTKLLDIVFSIAYKAGCNYTDALGSVAMWDTYIYRALNRKKIVVPPKTEKEYSPIVGGFVKDPHIGMSEWVVSFDLNSLYPHLMLQYNMSPETLVPGLVTGTSVDNCLSGKRPQIDEDYAVAANGAMFKRDRKGIIPEIIDDLYAQRKAIKKQMLARKKAKESGENVKESELNILHAQQMAIKIQMNSLYGCMANKWFRYFDRDMAEAITKSGQLSIRWAEKVINSFLNNHMKTQGVDYVIAIDTDSVYLNLKDLVDRDFGGTTRQIEEQVDEFCENVLKPEIDRGYKALAAYMNAYENRMVMEREVIATKAIWLAKKRYFMDVINSEGVSYEKPELKVMGVEAVKSSTPQRCREAFEMLFKVILRTDEAQVQESLRLFKNYFMTLDPEDIAFPRSVSNVTKWEDSTTIYKKGTPIHVRGSLVYNALVHQHGLEKTHELVKNGTKIKYVYLETPNLARENVIAFPQFLPEEFDLASKIDYDTQYEKAFLAGVTPILDVLGWKAEPENTLEAFC